jgi:hypothetical protein
VGTRRRAQSGDGETGGGGGGDRAIFCHFLLVGALSFLSMSCWMICVGKLSIYCINTIMLK